MVISLEELKKIEQLLDSPDPANVQLGLMILSGFAIDEEGANWLFDYYQKLANQEEKHSNKAIQALRIGTADSLPSKASHLLTLLLNEASNPLKIKFLNQFIYNETLHLPRLEFDKFPSVLLKNNHIKRLIWQEGNLREIPAEIELFTELTYLDLRHQPLEKIHLNLVKLKGLHTLWLPNALIVPEEIAELPNLDIFIDAAY